MVLGYFLASHFRPGGCTYLYQRVYGWVMLTISSLTCFISSDGELIAGVAVAYNVLSDHADVISGGRVEVNNSGLVELR